MWDAREWADLHGETPDDPNAIEYTECDCCDEEFPRAELTKSGLLFLCPDCIEKLENEE